MAGTSVRGAAWPSDRAAHRAWRARVLDGGGLPPHPAPEVRCRPARAGEVPTGTRQLAWFAHSRGWRGWCTYARGNPIHASLGTPLAVVDSMALHLRHVDGVRCAVAVWHGKRGKWDSKGAWRWYLDRPNWPVEVGVEALKEWL